MFIRDFFQTLWGHGVAPGDFFLTFSWISSTEGPRDSLARRAFFIRVRCFFCGGGGSGGGGSFFIFAFSLFFCFSLSLSRWPPVQSMRTLAWQGGGLWDGAPQWQLWLWRFWAERKSASRTVRPELGDRTCHANAYWRTADRTVTQMLPRSSPCSKGKCCPFFFIFCFACWLPSFFFLRSFLLGSVFEIHFRERIFVFGALLRSCVFGHVLPMCFLSTFVAFRPEHALKKFSSCQVFLFGSFSLFSGPRRRLLWQIYEGQFLSLLEWDSER